MAEERQAHENDHPGAGDQQQRREHARDVEAVTGLENGEGEARADATGAGHVFGHDRANEGKATGDAIRGPDLPMLQGLFLVFSAAVIVFNLLADLLYAVLDPRVRPA